MGLTVTVDTRSSVDLEKVRLRFGTITFDSSYPTGGESLTPADLHLQKAIGFLQVDAGAVVCKYDAANQRLMAYYGMPQHSHSLFLKNAAVADGATTRVNAGTNLLGANTGADITVAGGAATNGGVVNAAAAALAEASGADLSGLGALRYMAIGW